MSGPVSATDTASARLLANLEDIDDTSVQLRERRRSALRNLATLGTMRIELEQLIVDNVNVARALNSAYYDYGAPTWEEIGKALGVTKQAAQSRYGPRA